MALRRCWFIGTLIILLGIAGCSRSPGKQVANEAPIEAIQLRSSAFADSAEIPQAYTCDGKNQSPPLVWEGVPDNTQSLALIVEDPDAPAKTWVHWLLYDISPRVTNLSEGLAATAELPGIGTQGQNDFNQLGYGGPCPPGGKPHHYSFKIYALDKMLNLPSGATKKDLESAMNNHIIAQGQLTGLYSR